MEDGRPASQHDAFGSEDRPEIDERARCAIVLAGMGPPSKASGWVTGLGAVTSVGLDAATTCASIRAGIARPSEVDGHQSVSLLDYALVPTTGHVVPGLARGFSNVGRWLQLAAPAIEDLCASASLPSPEVDRPFWSATIAYLLVPGLSLRFIIDPFYSEAQLPGTLRDPLLRRVASVFAPQRVGVLPQGRPGLLELVCSIRWPIPGVQRVVIVATDSLVDVPALRWLSENRRLKNDDNPVGLSPAEASVALMLEDPDGAQQRGARPHAILHAVATDVDPERRAGQGPGGLGLARAVGKVLEQTSLQHGAAGHVADLNGEVWRAKELADARLRVGLDRWRDDHDMIPATSTGDPGVAMPALQLAVACKALERGYAPGSSLLVTSSDVRGGVGATIIGKG